jgi:hypothetical protein
MKKNILKEKILVVVSCLAIVASIVVSAIGVQEMVTPEAIVYEDSIDVNAHIDIGEDDVPLGKSKVHTKTSTKKTTKKKKLTKAATKTSTKTNISTTKSSSVKNTNINQVKTETTVKTTVATKHKKGSKTETITTTIVTIVKTTTTELESGIMEIHKVAPSTKAKAVVTLFDELGYQVIIDPTVRYTGYFNSRTKSITLKSNDKTTIYHELGHFLGYRAGNVDHMPDFKTIYEEEKSLYTAANKDYVLQSPSEYFAESYRNYVEDATSLKKQRPKTYKAIVAALEKMR